MIDKDHNYQINNEDHRREQAGRASGRDLQDARRTRGVREGRSRAGVPVGGQGDRYRPRRGHRQSRSDDRQSGGRAITCANGCWFSAVAALAVLGHRAAISSRRAISSTRACRRSPRAQYPEAVEHFKTAVELDPGFPPPGCTWPPPTCSSTSPARIRRRITRWRRRPSTISKGARAEPEEHGRHRFHRFPQPQPEEVGRGAAVVRQADRRGSAKRGCLLQHGFHRLVQVVSGLRYGARQPRHEAGRSRARSKTRRSRKS